ncbi:hypothetical protein, partial [Acidiplasma aeolicum]
VIILKIGESEVPGPEVYRMTEWRKWERLTFHMVIAYNDETNVLINTGMPLDLTERNHEMEKFAGERALFKSYDSIKILDSSKFKTEDIKNIAFTPMQDYTTGRLDEFKNARYFISRKGWIEDIITPGYHNIKRNLFIPEKQLKYLIFDAYSRIQFYESDIPVELIPGITAVWVGCHHRSSQAFIINTKKGKIVFTDASFKPRNVNENLPIGIAENIFECHKAYNYLRRYKNVLSAYDPGISDKKF